MAALGAQSIASSYEQLLHVDADGGGNTTTHVSVKDGDNGTTFGFTIATDALMMSSTNRLEFGDTGTYIHQSADGVLDLVSDTEIEINATTIDVNGALDLSGNAQLSGTVTVGADGSGTDVIFYSGTAGDNFTWDASEEKLTITGTNGTTALDVADGNLVVADSVDIEGDIDVNGTANLDAVDIDGAVQIDNTITVGADDQGYDVIFYGDTASSNMTWDTSEDDLVLNDARLFINQDDNVTAIDIDSEATTEPTIQIDSPATTTHYVLSVANADSLTTGSMARFHSNSSTTDTRNLVSIINDHASATGAVNLFIDQDANNEALFIDAENTTIGAVDIHCDALTTGRVARFYSDSSDNSTRNLVEITNDNASADNAVGLLIQQDGADASIELTGNGSIKFPGTQGASSDANSLDDYEEGTWTATMTTGGGSSTLNSSINECNYTKVGRLVQVQGYIRVDSSSSPTGGLSISGLPFTSISSAELSDHAAMSIRVDTLAGTSNSWMAYISDGSTVITLQIWTGTATADAGSFAVASTNWTFGGTYTV